MRPKAVSTVEERFYLRFIEDMWNIPGAFAGHGYGNHICFCSNSPKILCKLPYDPMVIVPRLAAYLGHKSYRETCWYIHLTVASFPELSQKLDRAFVGIIPVGGETDEEN